MKARCGACRRVSDHPMKEWAWVRYKGSAEEKLVCPECRKKAEAERGNRVSPAKL